MLNQFVFQANRGVINAIDFLTMRSLGSDTTDIRIKGNTDFCFQWKLVLANSTIICVTNALKFSFINTYCVPNARVQK